MINLSIQHFIGQKSKRLYMISENLYSYNILILSLGKTILKQVINHEI